MFLGVVLCSRFNCWKLANRVRSKKFILRFPIYFTPIFLSNNFNHFQNKKKLFFYQNHLLIVHMSQWKIEYQHSAKVGHTGPLVETSERSFIPILVRSWADNIDHSKQFKCYKCKEIVSLNDKFNDDLQEQQMCKLCTMTEAYG